MPFTPSDGGGRDPLSTLMMLMNLQQNRFAAEKQREDEALNMALDIAKSGIKLKDSLPMLREMGLTASAEQFVLGTEKAFDAQKKTAEAQAGLPNVAQAGVPPIGPDGKARWAPGQAEAFSAGIQPILSLPPEQKVAMLQQLAGQLGSLRGQQGAAIAGEQRAAATQRQTEIARENREEAKIDEGSLGMVLQFGTPDEVAKANEQLDKRYGERAPMMREKLWTRGVAAAIKQKQDIASSPGAAAQTLKADAYRQLGYNDLESQVLASGIAQPDPAPPPDVPARVLLGYTKEAAARRSAIPEMEATIDRIEPLLYEIAADPKAAAQVSGISGAQLLHDIRRLTSSQNALVARLGTLLIRGIRSSARMSDVGNLSDTDIWFAAQVFPLFSEMIDPMTGQVSAAALGRLSALRANMEDIRRAPYDATIKARLEDQVIDALTSLPQDQYDAVKEIAAGARPPNAPIGRTDRTRNESQRAEELYNDIMSEGATE